MILFQKSKLIRRKFVKIKVAIKPVYLYAIIAIEEIFFLVISLRNSKKIKKLKLQMTINHPIHILKTHTTKSLLRSI